MVVSTPNLTDEEFYVYENGEGFINSLEDKTDITEDNDIDFVDKIENEKLAKSVKLLSDREQKVVSLRIDKGLPIKEINIVIGTKERQLRVVYMVRH